MIARDDWLSISPSTDGSIAKKNTFQPATPFEEDIYDHFIECAKEHNGKGFAIIYTDNFDRKDKFVYHPINLDIEAFIKSIEFNRDGDPSGQAIMVVLDLAKPFEDQWPHQPGAIRCRAQLIENPVISDTLVRRTELDFVGKRIDSPVLGMVRGGRYDQKDGTNDVRPKPDL